MVYWDSSWYRPLQKSARFERRLWPDASLRSVDGRLRKAASLARLACGQIRSLKWPALAFAPGGPCCFHEVLASFMPIRAPFYGEQYQGLGYGTGTSSKILRITSSEDFSSASAS